ncbi:ethyl tert-butyl ether degradation protein EthD [Pandoraea terrae]|uniref:Ethyl tert-butyl ether degradation protein EthD n=1 Tax=Pandoraea terrae TaxID=1537710 RepID=A0A5E4SME9_9BURK|nr:EthD family reductase [Pandoraea terrae]VVD75534.1 ethyl tert-butyl ether degradation protein EthD [Pandoraea terrae]
MATLIVSYPATEAATFDRDYYLSTHVPLVRSAWSEFGLQSAEILFPAPGPQPFACMAILRFSDQLGVNAALSSAKTAEVIGDMSNFSNVAPTIFRADN